MGTAGQQSHFRAATLSDSGFIAHVWVPMSCRGIIFAILGCNAMCRALWWTAGVLVMLLIVLSLAVAHLEEPRSSYVEREFNRKMGGYTLTLGRLDVRPVVLSMDLEEAKLI